jgi:hypothetical protein
VDEHDAQVAIISRGSDMSVVLTSLIAQDLRLPVHLVLDRLPNKRDGFLLDTLRRTGSYVSLNLQEKPGVGQARYEVARFLEASTVICLDDDAMLYPHDALRQLYDAAQDNSFASPIIRYVHNFEGSGMPGHEEVWDVVDDADPRVQRALAANGDGWRRVYDYGTDQRSDDLGGTAFACDSGAYQEAVKRLEGWQGGGEDHYLGKKLCNMPSPYIGGPGVILSGVYAYHVGLFTPGKWGFDQVGLQYCRDEPESFRKRMVPDFSEPVWGGDDAASRPKAEPVPAEHLHHEREVASAEPDGIKGGTSLPVSERTWQPSHQKLGFSAT